MRHVVQMAAFALVVCSGCSSTPTRDAFSTLLDRSHARNSALRNSSDRSQSLAYGHESSAGFAGAKHVGTGSFVSNGRGVVARVTADASGNGYELNLVNAPIAEAAKAVLGDAMRVSYVVDPRVTGTVTLQTSKSVGRDALVDVFESALAVNGANLVKSGSSFKVVPAGDALSSTPTIRVGGTGPGGPGIQVQVIELQHIAAEEMKNLLEPMSRQGSILRTDSTRNLIVIAGIGKDLAAMREAISVFDVDWMRGMSVAIYPLKTSDPAAVSRELETIFGTSEGAGAKLVRFVPNKKLNAVLVITSRPAYLQRAATWITKLDTLAHNNDSQLFVYEIQNRPAKELAQVLRSVLSSKGGEQAEEEPAEPDSVAPALSPVLVSANNEPASEPADTGLAERMGIEPASAATSFAASAKSALSVTADVENNALLIQTTPREYERVEQILRQLDVLPTQVLLEAVIAEVTPDGSA